MKYDKEHRVMTCYIGNNEPHEWLTSSEGKGDGNVRTYERL